MKIFAAFLLSMAVYANVQAVHQPYVVPIYRVTNLVTTTAATTTATAPPSLMDKFSYVLETRQGRHPRSLVYDNKPRGIEGYSFEHVCSGTLVGKISVITTITCIESAIHNTDYYAWVGTAHDTTSTDSPVKVLYMVNQVIAHPDYNSTTNVHNIAVLKLATQVDFSPSGVEQITWALEIPAQNANCVTSYWNTDTPYEQVNVNVTVETCTPEKEGAICSSYTPTLTECPSGADGASLVCDSKVAGIFAPRRNYDCSATLWRYEELSKDAQWISESVNAATIF